MSRISKDLAHQIAIKLTEKSRLAAEVLNKEYREIATAMYEDQTPKDIKDCFKKHADWFYTLSYVRFDGHGFRWENVTTVRPVICNNGSDAKLELNVKTSSTLSAAKHKWEKAVENHKQLQLETETALINLGTHARIKENFPLAAPMLPPPMSNALVCNFDSLTKRLQKQPEVKKTETVK